MAQDGTNGNFQFVMSLRLETNEAEKRAHDMWETLREMSSQSILMHLEAKPHFQEAKRETDALQRKTQELIKASEAAEAKQKAFAKSLETTMARLDQMADNAAAAIHEAFDPADMEPARKKIEELSKELKDYSNVVKQVAAQQLNTIKTVQTPIRAASRGVISKMGPSEDMDRQLRSAYTNINRQGSLQQRLSRAEEELASERAKLIAKYGKDFEKKLSKMAEEDREAFKQLSARAKGLADDLKDVTIEVESLRESMGPAFDQYATILKSMARLRGKMKKSLQQAAAMRKAGANQEDMAAITNYQDWLKQFVIPRDVLQSSAQLTQRLNSQAVKQSFTRTKPQLRAMAKGVTKELFTATAEGFMAGLAQLDAHKLETSQANKIKSHTMSVYQQAHTKLWEMMAESALKSVAPALKGGGHLKALVSQMFGGMGGDMLSQVMQQAQRAGLSGIPRIGGAAIASTHYGQQSGRTHARPRAAMREQVLPGDIPDHIWKLWEDSERKSKNYADAREHERSPRTAGLSSASIRATRKLLAALEEAGFAGEKGLSAMRAMGNTAVVLHRAANDVKHKAVARASSTSPVSVGTPSGPLMSMGQGGAGDLQQLLALTERLEKQIANLTVNINDADFWQSLTKISEALDLLDARKVDIPINITGMKGVKQVENIQASLKKELAQKLKDTSKQIAEGKKIKVPLTVDQKSLMASLKAVLGNANRIPRVLVKAHQAVLMTSVEQALKKAFQRFNRSEDNKITLKEVKLPYDLLKIPVDKEYIARQIRQGVEIAQDRILKDPLQIPIVGSQPRTPTIPPATAAGTGRTRKGGKTPEEKAEDARLREVARAEKENRKMLAQADPFSVLNRLAGFDMDMMRNIDQLSRPTKPWQMMNDNERKDYSRRFSDVEQSFENDRRRFQEQYIDAVRNTDKGDAGTAESLRFAWEEFNKRLTDIANLFRDARNRNARSAITGGRDEAALQDYNKEVVQRMAANMSAFQNVYKLFGETPLDRHKDRVDQFKRVYNEIRKYEHELIAYTHARGAAEIAVADKRINKARRSVEIAQDELNIRLLAGHETVEARNLTSQFRLDQDKNLYNTVTYEKHAGQFVRSQVSMIEAYKETAALLRQEFGPGLDKANEALREYQKQLLVDAAEAEGNRNRPLARDLYNKAAGVREMNMEEMIAFSMRKSGTPEQQSLARSVMVDQMRDKLPQEERDLADRYRRRFQVDESQALNALLDRRLKKMGEEIRLWDTLDDKIRAARRELELLQRYDSLRSSRVNDPFGLRQAGRGLSHAVGGWAIGLSAGFYAMQSVRNYSGYQQELAGIQGVLTSKDPNDAQAIGEAIGQNAYKYGADLIETAKAARQLAQAGLSADEVMKELNYTMMGMRGMDMTIDQMAELQIAVKEVSNGLLSTSSILERISRIEAGYAVSAQDLAQAIQLTAPFMAQFDNQMRGMQDIFDYTIAYNTIMAQTLRVTGKEAANAMKFMMSRLLQPDILKHLQEDYGLKLGTADGSGLLPIDQIMQEVHSRWQELNASGNEGDRLKAGQMLAQLSGGRRVNFITALMEGYNKATRVAIESSYAFGAATERSLIAMDTLGAKAQQARNSFQLFVNNMMEGMLIADGLKAALWGVSLAMGGLSGQGGGPASMFIGLASVFAGIQGIRSFYDRMGMRRDAHTLGRDYGELRSAIVDRRRQQVADRVGLQAGDGPVQRGAARVARTSYATGALGSARYGLARTAAVASTASTAALSKSVAFFGPTGLLVLLTAGLTMIAGGMYRAFKKGTEGLNEFEIKLRSANDLRIWEAPQYQRLAEAAKTYNLQGTQGERTAQSAYERIYDTLLNDPTIQGIIRREGAGDANQLMAMYNDGQLGDRAPAIANEIIDAFIKSERMGEDFKNQLLGIEDAAERAAVATRLIGEAAFAANYQLANLSIAFRDSATRVIETSAAGMQELDTSNRRDWFTRGLGHLLDGITLKTTLQRGFVLRGSESRNQGEADRMMRDLLNDSGMAEGVVETLTKETSVFGRAMNEVISAMHEAGEASVSMADLLANAADIIDNPDRRNTSRWAEKFIADGRVQTRIIDPGQQTLKQEMIAEVGQTLMSLTGYHTAVETLNPQFSLDAKPINSVRGSAWLTGIMQEGSKWAQAQVEAYNMDEHGESFQLESLHQFTKAVEHVALTLDAGSAAMNEFRDKFADIFLNMYRDLAKLDSDDRFAQRNGLAFDRAGSRMSLFQGVFQQLDLFDEELRISIVKSQIEAQNLARSTFNMPRRQGDRIIQDTYEATEIMANIGGIPPEVLAEFEKQKQEVAGRIAAQQKQFEELVRSGMHTVASFFPDTEEFKEIARYVDTQLETINRAREAANGDPTKLLQVSVMQDRLLDGLLRRAEAEYNIARQLQFQKALAQQNSEFTLKTAERIAEVRRVSLELENNLTERTRQREAIEWELVTAKKAALDAQLQARDIDEDEYKIKVRELELETNLTLQNERRMEVERNIVSLRKQGISNIDASLAGLKSSITDLGAIGALIDKNGTSESRSGARDSLIQGLLGSVGTTLYARFIDNMMTGVTKRLSEMQGISSFFELPESEMTRAVSDGGQIAANYMYTALDTGGVQLANRISSAIADGITTAQAITSNSVAGQHPSSAPFVNVGPGSSVQRRVTASALGIDPGRPFPHIPDHQLTPEQISYIQQRDPRLAGGTLRLSDQGYLVYDSGNVDRDFRGRPMRSPSDPSRQSRPTHKYSELASFLMEGETVEQAEARILRESNFLNPAVLRTETDLDALVPAAESSFRQFIAALEERGISVRVNETHRSRQRADALFRAGRAGPNMFNPANPSSASTWTLTSNHVDGTAADLVLNGDTSGRDPAYAIAGQLADQYGLKWFGSGDAGHFSLRRDLDNRSTASLAAAPLRGGDPTSVIRADAAAMQFRRRNSRPDALAGTAQVARGVSRQVISAQRPSLGSTLVAGFLGAGASLMEYVRDRREQVAADQLLLQRAEAAAPATAATSVYTLPAARATRTPLHTLPATRVTPWQPMPISRNPDPKDPLLPADFVWTGGVTGNPLAEFGGVPAPQPVTTGVTRAVVGQASPVPNVPAITPGVVGPYSGFPAGIVTSSMLAARQRRSMKSSLITTKYNEGRITPGQQFAMQAGMMVGNMGGTLIGDGGKWAQTGASAGSTLGLIAGSPWGPVGMAIGSAAGGLLGGLIGGEFDKGNKDKTVPTLQAIERAQKETITAIERQTDALINPAAMLMNLPTNFAVPGYLPQFASGGGSSTIPGGGPGSQQFNVEVNISGSGGDATEIKTAVKAGVQEGIAKALEEDRRNSAKRVRRI